MAGAAGGAGVEIGRVSVRVLPDLDKFYRDLKTKLEQIEKTLRGTVHVDVELNEADTAAEMRALMSRLRAQAAQGIDIEANVTRGMGDRLQGLTRQLQTVGDSAGYAGQQFLGLTRTGWIVAAVAAAAAPAVGLVSGLLAGLPSLASAFAAGAGAIALGMDGIKASAESLVPDLDALKASVSDVFEQRLTPIFDQLRGIFPSLQAGMSQVADGMADMFQGVTNALTSGQGLAQLETILANVGSMFSGLQPILQTATGSFLTLSEAGSNAFGKLLAPMQTFATGFDAMVNRITSSGAFDAAMGGLSQTLDSVLGLFTRLMESGVQAMGQLGGPLSTLINGLGDAFIAAMPALTSFSALIGNVGGTLLSALAPAIQAITPAFTALANTLGAMLASNLQALAPILTQVASALGTTLLTALQAIQPMLPQLLTTFQQFATVVSTQLAQYLPSLADSFGKMLAAILPLTPALLQLGTQALTALLPAMTALAPVVVTAVAAFANLVGAVSSVVQGFLQAGAAVQNFVATAVAAITAFVGQAIAELQSLPGKIQGAVSGFGTLLVSAGRDLIQGLINGIKSMASAAIGAAKNIASSVADAVKGALGINSPSKVFAEIGVNVGQGFTNGMESATAGAVKAAEAMSSRVTDAMKPADDFAEFGEKTLRASYDFGRANVNQLMGDLGISGQGALPQLLEQGIALGEHFIFNVGSMDEAVAGQQTIQNKKALQFDRR
jgi:phage-related protein